MRRMIFNHRTATWLGLALCAPSFAQLPSATLYSQANPATSLYWLAGFQLAERPDGGYLVLVSTSDTVLMSGLDAQGDLQWTHAFTVPAGNNTVLQDMVTLTDGTWAACGYTGSSGLYLHGDTSGNVLSARSYTSGFDSRFFGMALRNDGGPRLVGYRQTFGVMDAIVVDVDVNGDLLSASQCALGNVTTWPYDLLATPDGGHMMVGASRLLNGNGQLQYVYGHVARFDTAGTLLWSRRLQVNGERTYMERALVNGDGSVTCWVTAGLTANIPVLVRFDAEGNLVSSVQLNLAAPASASLTSGAFTALGDTAFSGVRGKS